MFRPQHLPQIVFIFLNCLLVLNFCEFYYSPSFCMGLYELLSATISYQKLFLGVPFSLNTMNYDFLVYIKKLEPSETFCASQKYQLYISLKLPKNNNCSKSPTSYEGFLDQLLITGSISPIIQIDKLGGCGSRSEKTAESRAQSWQPAQQSTRSLVTEEILLHYPFLSQACLFHMYENTDFMT